MSTAVGVFAAPGKREGNRVMDGGTPRECGVYLVSCNFKTVRNFCQPLILQALVHLATVRVNIYSFSLLLHNLVLCNSNFTQHFTRLDRDRIFLPTKQFKHYAHFQHTTECTN